MLGGSRIARRLPLVAALFAVLVAVPSAALANDSALGGAGAAVKPITSSTIRMTAETVQVTMFGYFAEYQVDFQFTNSGDPQTVKLGFPFPLPFEDAAYSPQAAFRAWQDGKRLPVTYQVVAGANGDRTGYYIHEAVFPPGDTMIRVRYYAVPDTSVRTEDVTVTPPADFAGASWMHGSYPYTVSTGAGWAGTIGTSIIRYYVSADAKAWGFERAIEA